MMTDYVQNIILNQICIVFPFQFQNNFQIALKVMFERFKNKIRMFENSVTFLVKYLYNELPNFQDFWHSIPKIHLPKILNI